MTTSSSDELSANREPDARTEEERRGDEDRQPVSSPLAAGLAPWDLLPPDLLLVRRRPVPR